MVDFGGFPAVMPGTEQLTIFGETWIVNQETLKSLDLLEGHPQWYKREKVLSNFLEKRVWVYIMPAKWEGRARDLVVSGIWRPDAAELAFWDQEGIQFDGR